MRDRYGNELHTPLEWACIHYPKSCCSEDVRMRAASLPNLPMARYEYIEMMAFAYLNQEGSDGTV